MWRGKNSPSNNSTNIHHKITKQCGGSNHHDNLVEMKVIAHNWLHFLFDNKPFHQQVETLIGLMWPTVNKILTDDLKDVIQSYTLEDMYNMKCIKDFDTFVRFVNRK